MFTLLIPAVVVTTVAGITVVGITLVAGMGGIQWWVA